jgi:hypothetical protein
MKRTLNIGVQDEAQKKPSMVFAASPARLAAAAVTFGLDVAGDWLDSRSPRNSRLMGPKALRFCPEMKTRREFFAAVFAGFLESLERAKSKEPGSAQQTGLLIFSDKHYSLNPAPIASSTNIFTVSSE